MTVVSDVVAPLFVPANRPERFEKAATSGADAIIIDLEDAVQPDAKVTARSSLRAGLSVPVLVRINGIGTRWHQDDLAAVLQMPFTAVVVPKAERSEEFEALCVALKASSKPVLALIETAKGLSDARAIAAMPNVERLAFGSIDFCADIGCSHTRDALLLARSELVFASRLAQRAPPIDGVTTAINDPETVNSDSRYARDLGFGGKLCIHPQQLAPITLGFSPTDTEIAWARKVVESIDGAVSVNGEMVDKPVRDRAHRILEAVARQTSFSTSRGSSSSSGKVGDNE